MAKTDSTGVRQLPDGNWEYRLTRVIDGKKRDIGGKLDENGNPFKTRRDAKAARDARIQELRNPPKKTHDATLREVYELNLQHGTAGKADATLVKHDSMWRNHFNPEFGDRLLSDITHLELQSFIEKKYASGNYKHSYVEGFLKFMYLLYGTAYRHELIDNDRYYRMFKESGTRIFMPKMTQEDKEEAEIVVFEKHEIEKINYILKGGHADCYLPFLVGYLCGLRISECFGLMWDDIDWENMTLRVRKQLLYQKGVWCLCPVKTLASDRTIDFPKMINNHLYEHKRFHEQQKKKLGFGYKNHEIVLDKLKDKDGIPIKSGDFIFRKTDGTLMTPNAFKYWTRVLADNGIAFKYHYLRHTHLTQMADAGVNMYTLMTRAGHLRLDTSLKYYINRNSLSRKFLVDRLNEVKIEEPKHSFKIILSDEIDKPEYLYSDAEVENINKEVKKKTPRKR